MESYNRFSRSIFERARSLLKFIGLDYLKPHFEPNWKTYGCYIVAASFIVVDVHTALYYDLTAKFVAAADSLLVFQCIVRTLTSRYFKDTQWCVNLLLTIFRAQVGSEDQERFEYFHRFSLFSEVLFKCMIIIYCGLLSLFPIYPIYICFSENKLIPIIPLYVPLLDEQTYWGYFVLIIYQFMGAFLAVTGLIAFEFLFSIIIIGSLIFAKTISLEIKQMNADSECDKETSRALAVKCRCTNIILMHHQLLEYMDRVEKIGFDLVFAQVGTAFFGSIVCLYTFLALNYLPICCILCGMIFQIFVACVLGTFAEITHDRIYDASLKMNWPNFSKREKVMYILFVYACQRPKLLTIGGFYDLNMDTCVTIYNKIYTITMLMYQFVA